MKKIFSLITALGMACALYAQTPANDDCAGLIDLGTAPGCTPTVYSNVGATPSNIGNDNLPSCFNSGTAQRDVWFMFTCPDTLFEFRITLTGVGANSIENPEFAVYRGDCEFDGLAELLCAKADVGENSLFLDVTGLTPGAQYFIRVSDYSLTATPNSGDFTLCVDKIPPIVTIDQGSSTLCEGTLYDSGGPDGDYGPNEDYTFVICPSTPAACITFTLEYFNIEEFGFELLSFYDGDNTNVPPITQINSGFFGEPVGGGGVCFQVQASSGCLTVQFQSDDFTEFEGWKGSWTCSTQPCPQQETLSVSTGVSNEDIAEAVSTPLTTVTVTSVNCDEGAYGTFSFPTADNPIGLQKGLVLTSGGADLVVGPNLLTGNGFALGLDGDADLDFLSQQGNGQQSFDACVIEMDVVANTDELVFEYVFGSEEYPEFVNSFNDIFAFLISGPGIAGDPGLGGAKNIAVLPFTNTPVQINSVNNDVNWQYYRNNEGEQLASQVLEYDGLTADTLGIKKSLTARSAVIPCNTYHLKIAVADRGDFALDSGVFMSDIKAGAPEIVVQFTAGIDYLTESCLPGVQDLVVLSIQKAQPNPVKYKVTIGGTATLGTDYTLGIPDTITFLPGQTQLSFPIAPISDAISEGTETITIQLSNDYGCGEVILKTITIELKEKAEVEVIGGDTLFVCTGGTLQLTATGAAEYFWAPPGAVSNPFIANPTITPTQDIWLEVSGTVGVCTDVDSVFIDIIDPEIDVVALSDTNICVGTQVFLQAINNVNSTGLVWTPATGLDDENSTTPIATPSVTTKYTATINIAGCSVSDFVTINVDTLFFPDLVDESTICQNYSLQLGNMLNSTTEYLWTPTTGLNDPTSSGPIATPDVTTTYTLTATSANGYCSQTESVTVNVTPANVEIGGDDYLEICLGETVDLTAQSSPAGATVQWSPSFYVSNTTGPTTTASPDESVTIFATYTINGCLVRDSVRIRVDSLPDQTIVLVPDKEIYCPGDTILILSPNEDNPVYQPGNFPDIQIEWLPAPGQETPVEKWNMVLTADKTDTLYRVLTNRGCLDTSSVIIPVGVPPDIIIQATPENVCPGGTSQINVTVDPPDTKLEWQDMPPTLSCSTCPDPIATLTQTTTYTVTTPGATCPSSLSVTINVIPPPALNLPANPTFCIGGNGILLNTISEPGVQYEWSPATGLDDPDIATPTATPTTETTYSVIATLLTPPGCSSTGTVTVAIDQPFTLDLANDTTICAGKSVRLSQTNLPGITYNWSPNVGLDDPGIATPTATPTTGTTYTVMAVRTACTFNGSVTIDVLQNPMLNLPADPELCPGGDTLLNTITEQGVDYQWTPATGLDDPFSATPTASPAATTTYSVKAETQVGGCISEGTVTVTRASATIDAGPPQAVCFGDNASLTATTTGTAGTITWPPFGVEGSTFSPAPLVSTTYTALLTYGPGCTTSDSVQVTVVPGVTLSAITATPDPSELVCVGLPITLEVEVTPATAIVTWLQNDTLLNGIRGDSVTFVPSVPEGTALFTVIATAANNCTATAGPITYTFRRCIAVPNAFTPNNDAVNDTFGPVLFGTNTEVTTFHVFNRWGKKVFEATPSQQRWDGTDDGKESPSDVYAYYIVVQYADGTEETLKGDIALLR